MTSDSYVCKILWLIAKKVLMGVTYAIQFVYRLEFRVEREPQLCTGSQIAEGDFDELDCLLGPGRERLRVERNQTNS